MTIEITAEQAKKFMADSDAQVMRYRDMIKEKQKILDAEIQKVTDIVTQVDKASVKMRTRALDVARSI